MKFPNQLPDRLASTVATTQRLVATAHQRLNTIGSQVGALQPGDWTLVTLISGWSNVAGYIPAQVRIQQSGLALLVGHVHGGLVANGTIIGQLTTGYFNPTHSHALTANVLAGAATTAVTGTVTGSTDIIGLPNGTTQGTSGQAGLPNGQIQGTSAGGSNTNGHTHGAGNMSVINGQHTHSGGSYSVTDGKHQHTTTSLVPSLPVNYNTVILTVDTAGNLILSNCPATATQLSFNEQLPLVTS